MISAGIDAGSRAIKVVLVNCEDLSLVACGMIDQGVEQNVLAEGLLDNVLSGVNLSREDLGSVVATGYGRDMLDVANETITEITCHAKGVSHLQPDCMTVIDIGGQDSKLIRLREDGRVRDFVMNDRCAAGTGRFIEVVADRLKVGLDELGAMAAGADMPSPISSMCVVFAETEITGLLASGEKRGNIVAGVQASIASRIVSMAGRNLKSPVMFAGGVALVSGMKEALESVLECPVSVVENPQFTGALGAALLACELLEKQKVGIKKSVMCIEEGGGSEWESNPTRTG